MASLQDKYRRCLAQSTDSFRNALAKAKRKAILEGVLQQGNMLARQEAAAAARSMEAEHRERLARSAEDDARRMKRRAEAA